MKRKRTVFFCLAIGLLLSVFAATAAELGQLTPVTDMDLQMRYDVTMDQLSLTGELTNGMRIGKVVRCQDQNNPLNTNIFVYGKKAHFKMEPSFSFCLPVKNGMVLTLQQPSGAAVIFQEADIFPLISLDVPWQENTIGPIDDRFAAEKLRTEISLSESGQIPPDIIDTLYARASIKIVLPVAAWRYPDIPQKETINIYNLSQKHYARLPDHTVKLLSNETIDDILCFLRVSKAKMNNL